jgi:hypothetical protein
MHVGRLWKRVIQTWKSLLLHNILIHLQANPWGRGWFIISNCCYWLRWSFISCQRPRTQMCEEWKGWLKLLGKLGLEVVPSGYFRVMLMELGSYGCTFRCFLFERVLLIKYGILIVLLCLRISEILMHIQWCYAFCYQICLAYNMNLNLVNLV